MAIKTKGVRAKRQTKARRPNLKAHARVVLTDVQGERLARISARLPAIPAAELPDLVVDRGLKALEDESERIPWTSGEVSRILAVKLADLSATFAMAYDATTREKSGENEPTRLLHVARCLRALSIGSITKDDRTLAAMGHAARTYLERPRIRSLRLDERGEAAEYRPGGEVQTRDGAKHRLPDSPVTAVTFRGGDVRPERAEAVTFLRDLVIAYLKQRHDSRTMWDGLRRIIVANASGLRVELAQARIDLMSEENRGRAERAIEKARSRDVPRETPARTAERIITNALAAVGYGAARSLFDAERKKTAR